MPEGELKPPYTLYYANRCEKCQKFLHHVQGLTIGQHLVYFDVQQQRPPKHVQFVPTLVDNQTQRQHVGRQAFDLLQLWLQEKSMTTAPTIGRKELQYGDYDSGTAMTSGIFGAEY